MYRIVLWTAAQHPTNIAATTYLHRSGVARWAQEPPGTSSHFPSLRALNRHLVGRFAGRAFTASVDAVRAASLCANRSLDLERADAEAPDSLDLCYRESKTGGKRPLPDS
jgi:hypothetical protein